MPGWLWASLEGQVGRGASINIQELVEKLNMGEADYPLDMWVTFQLGTWLPGNIVISGSDSACHSNLMFLSHNAYHCLLGPLIKIQIPKPSPRYQAKGWVESGKLLVNNLPLMQT